MSAKLYVEGSLCLTTGAAGWGAVLDMSDVSMVAGGQLHGDFSGAVTIMELEAVKMAAEAVVTHGYRDMSLTIAMRSTAALAVLRWVFPEAPFLGKIYVQPPRSLKPAVQRLECLYQLDEITLANRFTISLSYADGERDSLVAQGMARTAMEHARGPQRRAAK